MGAWVLGTGAATLGKVSPLADGGDKQNAVKSPIQRFYW